MFSLSQVGTTAEDLAVSWIVRRINMEKHQSAQFGFAVLTL